MRMWEVFSGFPDKIAMALAAEEANLAGGHPATLRAINRLKRLRALKAKEQQQRADFVAAMYGQEPVSSDELKAEKALLDIEGKRLDNSRKTIDIWRKSDGI